MAEPVTIEGLEALKDRAAALVKQYELVTQTEVPTSLKQAIDQRWELAVNLVEVPWLLEYPHDLQLEDSRRAISARLALDLLDQYADSVLHLTVNYPKEPFFSGIQSALKMCFYVHDFGGLLWDAIKVILNVTSITDLLLHLPTVLGKVIDAVSTMSLRAAFLIADVLLVAAGLSHFSDKSVTVLKGRDAIVKEMRRGAYPQRHPRRVTRRKLAR